MNVKAGVPGAGQPMDLVPVATTMVCVAVLILLVFHRKIPALMITALSLTVFTVGYSQLFVPVRYLIEIQLVILLCALIWTGDHGTRGHGRGFVVLGIAVLSTYVFVVLDPFGPQRGEVIFRYVIMYPLAFYAGRLVWLSREHRLAFTKAYCWTALGTALLAIVEFASGSRLFPRGAVISSATWTTWQWMTSLDVDTRYGSLRASVLAEHPLVLATLLVVAVPLMWNLLDSRPVTRLSATMILVLGIAATGSRGVIVCATAWILFIISMRFFAAHQVLRWTRVLACLGCLIGIGWIFLFPPSVGALASAESDSASAEYRLQLYGGLKLSLDTKPLGWGVEGLPRGVYVLKTDFGDLDLANTVDSEVASLGFEFGLIGLGIFAILIVMLLSGRWLVSPVGQSAALCTLCGLFLALHAWTGLSTVWLLLLGALTAGMRSGGKWSARYLGEAADRHKVGSRSLSR